MPRLNERKPSPPRVPTFLNLPQATRDELIAAIDHVTIHSLTDAVVAAAKLLTKTRTKARTAKETR